MFHSPALALFYSDGAQTYILKSTWKHYEATPTEDQPYPILDERDHSISPHVYSSRRAQINGRDDTTCEFTCPGLEPAPKLELISTPEHRLEPAETGGDFSHVRVVSGGEHPISSPEGSGAASEHPESRVRIQILMKISGGWPIKYFKDLLELLGTLRSAVIGSALTLLISVCHNSSVP